MFYCFSLSFFLGHVIAIGLPNHAIIQFTIPNIILTMVAKLSTSHGLIFRIKGDQTNSGFMLLLVLTW